MKLKNGKSHVGIVKMTMFVVFLIMFFGAITFRAIHHDTSIYSEYAFHIEKSQAMRSEGRILEPHFLFHALTIAVHEIVTLGNTTANKLKPGPAVFESWALSALLVITAAYVATTLLLYRLFQSHVGNKNESLALAPIYRFPQPTYIDGRA